MLSVWLGWLVVLVEGGDEYWFLHAFGGVFEDRWFVGLLGIYGL